MLTFENVLIFLIIAYLLIAAATITEVVSSDFELNKKVKLILYILVLNIIGQEMAKKELKANKETIKNNNDVTSKK